MEANDLPMNREFNNVSFNRRPKERTVNGLLALGFLPTSALTDACIGVAYIIDLV
jgi:hypothetical protein